MANATLAWPTLPAKEGDVLALPQGAVSLFAGSAGVVVRGTGHLVAMDLTAAAPQLFVGVLADTFNNASGQPGAVAAGARFMRVQRNGVFKFDSTGLVAADIGKKAFFSDDHTVSLTASNICAGCIVNVDDAGAWVEIDSAVQVSRKTIPLMSPAIVAAAGATVREQFGRVPTGAVWIIQAAAYRYQTKPNFATSAALDMSKLKAADATRTTLLSATVNVNNTTPAVDVDTALTLTATAADRTLVAGDILEASIVTVGALTAAGKTTVSAEVLEIGATND